MKISALVIVALAVLVTAIRAASFDRVWSGAGGDSDWHNSANWEPSAASPQPGERVLLADSCGNY
ncbi:MAG: hypothetical protein GX230_10560 [Lentisphaerae bacterium]|nr:hypothetical protein [Lentisphaerota bacterium]